MVCSLLKFLYSAFHYFVLVTELVGHFPLLFSQYSQFASEFESENIVTLGSIQLFALRLRRFFQLCRFHLLSCFCRLCSTFRGSSVVYRSAI